MIRKTRKYTLEETIDLYADYQRARQWARTADKINTCLPKTKAEKWDAIEEEADRYLNNVEKELAGAVDSLNEEDLDKFREHYGI